VYLSLDVPATAAIYTLSLHDALPISLKDARAQVRCALFKPKSQWLTFRPVDGMQVLARGRVTLYEPRGEYQLIIDHLEEELVFRSEEHTSELQSRENLVCRLLLEKKK